LAGQLHAQSQKTRCPVFIFSAKIKQRQGGGGRRDRSSFCTETLTMIFLNMLLLVGTVGVLCWLMFTLAIYALPVAVGVTVGLWAHGYGAGPAGGFIGGALAAGAVAILGQLTFAFARPLWVRLIVAILFAGPAAVAGYAATHGIAKHFMPSDGWQMAFSIVGAGAVGVTALFRMAGTAPPDPGLERARDA
jgi:hypothetical protein